MQEYFTYESNKLQKGSLNQSNRSKVRKKYLLKSLVMNLQLLTPRVFDAITKLLFPVKLENETYLFEQCKLFPFNHLYCFQEFYRRLKEC